MSSTFTLSSTVEKSFDDTLEATRAALADQGFGIITEIDLAATLKEKLGVDVPSQVILGACRPQLAHQAVLADPSIATVLPCNVVVREVGSTTCVVEAFDPDAMMRMSDDETLAVVATDARARLVAALGALAAPAGDAQEG